MPELREKAAPGLRENVPAAEPLPDFRNPADEFQKGMSGVKKVLSLAFVVVLVLALAGCGQGEEAAAGDLPPMLDMCGRKYMASSMPVCELPEGYTYLV